MFSRRMLTHFDYVLFGAALLLALIGVVGVFSASSPGGSSSIFLRQLLWVGMGVALCILVVTLDYHFLTDHAFALYGLALLGLVGVLLFGTEINNSRSWVAIGGVGLQPSELVKIIVILALTRYLAERNENTLQRRHVITMVVLVLMPMVLIMLQGDLGTALIYVPILLGIMLVAGLKLRILAVVLLALVCLAPLGWLSLKDYQQQRIMVALDPDLDPQGVGYQARQSQIAIGSGGMLGKGLGNGLQSQLGFVPEIHTDFIFALLAEETGLIGAGVILALYIVLLTRLVRIAESARDRAGILLISGIMSYLFGHVFVNLGMVVGILPAVGIPLPLLSYGGSSMLTVFLAIGLALNVHYRRYVY